MKQSKSRVAKRMDHGPLSTAPATGKLSRTSLLESRSLRTVERLGIDVEPGDFCDFGVYGQHYVVGEHSGFYLIQDDVPTESDFADPNLTGAIHQSDFKRVIKSYEDTLSEDEEDFEESVREQATTSHRMMRVKEDRYLYHGGFRDSEWDEVRKQLNEEGLWLANPDEGTPGWYYTLSVGGKEVQVWVTDEPTDALGRLAQEDMGEPVREQSDVQSVIGKLVKGYSIKDSSNEELRLALKKLAHEVSPSNEWMIEEISNELDDREGMIESVREQDESPTDADHYWDERELSPVKPVARLYLLQSSPDDIRLKLRVQARSGEVLYENILNAKTDNLSTALESAHQFALNAGYELDEDPSMVTQWSAAANRQGESRRHHKREAFSYNLSVNHEDAINASRLLRDAGGKIFTRTSSSSPRAIFTIKNLEAVRIRRILGDASINVVSLSPTIESQRRREAATWPLSIPAGWQNVSGLLPTIQKIIGNDGVRKYIKIVFDTKGGVLRIQGTGMSSPQPSATFAPTQSGLQRAVTVANSWATLKPQRKESRGREAVDLRCPNCRDNLGKDVENTYWKFCPTCGFRFINPRGFKDRPPIDVSKWFEPPSQQKSRWESRNPKVVRERYLTGTSLAKADAKKARIVFPQAQASFDEFIRRISPNAAPLKEPTLEYSRIFATLRVDEKERIARYEQDIVTDKWSWKLLPVGRTK